MSWPGMAEYAAAVQTPRASFLLPELKSARIATNAIGLPRVSSGAFAVVFEATVANSVWAVRCFTRDVTDLEARYVEIQRHMASVHLPYFVSFLYTARGILVNGRPYPLVKMEWVRGVQLAEYVQQNLSRPDSLLRLAAQFGELNRRLEESRIGHGDISADNVIVTPDGIKLIDYDGMYVPSLAGRRARELGNPDFQHPGRDETLFGPGVDRFSVLVVCAALVALAADNSLWKRFGDGNGLLFSASDLRAPGRSDLFRGLLGASDPTVATLTRELVNWLRADPKRLNPLPTVSGLRVTATRIYVPSPGPVPAPPASGGPRWWEEHAGPPVPEPRPPVAPPRPPQPVSATPQRAKVIINWGVIGWTALVCVFLVPATSGVSLVVLAVVAVAVIVHGFTRGGATQPSTPAPSPAPLSRRPNPPLSTPPSSARPSPWPTTSPSSSHATRVVASAIRTKFHRPSCRWARRIRPGNLVTYSSSTEARAAGRSPCGECNP